jgi:hypothetical protein
MFLWWSVRAGFDHAFGRRFKPASIKRRIISDLVTPSARASKESIMS